MALALKTFGSINETAAVLASNRSARRLDALKLQFGG
jgi:hypothetical protein